MKKIMLLFAAISMLALAACAMVSCGDKNKDDECTVHTDINDDLQCDICGAQMPLGVDDDAAKEVNVRVKINDHYGNPISGMIIDFVNTEEPDYDVKSGATDANGIVEVTLHVGEYDVRYTNTPVYHIPGSSFIKVTEDMSEWAVSFVNNTPDGTIEHPYFFDSENPNVTLPANTSYYYRVYHAKGLVLNVTGEGYVITYKGNEYAPENGSLIVIFDEEDLNSAALLNLKNVTDSDITVQASVGSAPGSFENPYVVESDGASTEVLAENVIYDNTIYYAYAVTADGTVTVSTDCENVYLVIRNGDVVYNNGIGGETASVSAPVSAGDVIKISVATTDKTATEVGVDISFTITFEEAAE